VRKLRHLLEYAFFLAVSGALGFLPLGAAICAGQMLGVLAYYLWGSRRRIALANVRAAHERGALPQGRTAETVVKAHFRHLGRTVAEIVKILHGRGDVIMQGLRLEGEENFQRAFAKGKGVILASAHCGNWELIASLTTRLPGVHHGIIRRLNNPYLNRLIMRTRESWGIRIVYKEGALRAFLGALKRGESVGIAIDQGVSPAEGVLIDFLGAPAWTTRSPAALAKRTGAAVVPVFIRNEGAERIVTIHPEVELSGDEVEDTRRMSAYVEDFIRRWPEQWLWIHRRWKRTGGPHAPVQQVQQVQQDGA
jgi:KDO2-lipid IV(A) lauroyltransferase